jgi:hypothetical protein
VSRRPIRLEAFLGEEPGPGWLGGVAFVLLSAVCGLVFAGIAAGVGL